jgi:hypothetical protein
MLAGEEQQVPESLRTVAEGKEMAGSIPVQREPSPDSKVHRDAEQQIEQDRRLNTSTAEFHVQGQHLIDPLHVAGASSTTFGKDNCVASEYTMKALTLFGYDGRKA